MLWFFLLSTVCSWPLVYSQDANGYAALQDVQSTTAKKLTTATPPGYCTANCAKMLFSDLNMIVGKNGNLTDINRLREMLSSPMTFTSNQSDMIIRICKHGYRDFKPCIADCPKSEKIDLILISLRPLDYVCRDHLKEFVDALPCITNVSIEVMKNQCKPIVDKIMNMLNETLARVNNPSKQMSLDETVAFIDMTCGYGYEFLKCMLPSLVKKCGKNVEKLILDAFDIALDTIIKLVGYLKSNLAKKANITIKSSAVQCPKAKDDVESMIGNIFQFGRVIDCTHDHKFPLVISFIKYNGYGCYCGIGGSGNPVDRIDRCCQVHDNCYDKCHEKKGWWKFRCSSHIATYSVICNIRTKSARCERSQSACKKCSCQCDVEAAYCLRANANHFKLFQRCKKKS